ncbi:Synaptosomal-associated protein 23 [Aphelenchoides besseyi]|nr:Synaptosomal-associated protein 23 [Aphelenchoides besseyi]
MMEEMKTVNDSIDRKTNESLVSTRRIVGLCVGVEDTATKTVTDLYHQGDMLNRVEAQLDHMNIELKATQENVKEMRKCCGLCVLRNKSKEHKTSIVDGKPESVVSNRITIFEQPTLTVGTSISKPSRDYIRQIADDDRENEIKGNLKQIGGILENMQKVTYELNNKISTQNFQLDYITNQSESNRIRVKDATNYTKY